MQIQLDMKKCDDGTDKTINMGRYKVAWPRLITDIQESFIYCCPKMLSDLVLTHFLQSLHNGFEQTLQNEIMMFMMLCGWSGQTVTAFDALNSFTNGVTQSHSSNLSRSTANLHYKILTLDLGRPTIYS